MSRLEKDRLSIKPIDTLSFKEVMLCAGSPHVLIFCTLSFMNVTMAYGLGLFLPSIVNEFGFSPNTTQLMSAGPFAAGFFGELFVQIVMSRLPSLGLCTIPCSDFICCVFVGPVQFKRDHNDPCHHARHCRFCSLSR